MKKYLTIFIVFLFIFVIRVNAEEYKTGELIKYKGIKFYVIEDNDDYLTLLKATPFKLEELKNYTTLTKASFEDYYMGSLPYCKDNSNNCKFETSNIKEALDNWSKDKLDNNDLVESKIPYLDNATKYKVRLLTKDELVNKFSYVKDSSSSAYYSSQKTPKWITNYDYWIMYSSPADTLHQIVSEGYALSSYPVAGKSLNEASASSLRPVINLSKKASITKLKPAVKSITDSEFKIGDIVEYNDVEYYVIKNSTKNDKTVTMVKRMPLTKKEVEIYDGQYTSIGTQYDINDEENNSIDTYKYIPYYYRENACNPEKNNSLGEHIDEHTEQCQNDYESSDVKKIVDIWAKENVKSSDLAKDETGYAVRIISVNDLTDNLGYVSTVSTISNSIIGSVYHQAEGLPFNLLECWTMTPVNDTKEYEYNIERFASSYSKTYDGSTVCPVITVNKNQILNQSKDDKLNIPDTLLKNPVFIVVIGIVLIVIATIIVSIILKRKK